MNQRVADDEVRHAIWYAHELLNAPRTQFVLSGFECESATLPRCCRGNLWRMTEVWRDRRGNTIVLRHRFRVPQGGP